MDNLQRKRRRVIAFSLALALLALMLKAVASDHVEIDVAFGDIKVHVLIVR